MTSLTSHLSSDYQKARNCLAPRSASKSILVYVEGIDDVSFWYAILNHYEKQAKIKFDIQPYSNNALINGKKGLEKLFNNTGEYLIICLDSDYDYLVKDHSEISISINNNPFIFQTYAYSIENIKCYAENLSNVCVQVTNNTNEKINFPELVKRYSEIVYDLFIWNLYFYSINDTASFTISDFNSVIKIIENPKVEEYGETALENLKARVNAKLQELQNQFQEHEKKLEPFAKQFECLGLFSTKTYLFIHGHTLYENVIQMFLKPICKALINDHKSKIKGLAKHETEASNSLKNYNNLVGRLDDKITAILSSNNKFEDCFLYQKIQDDIEAYIKKHFFQVDAVPSA